MENNKELSAILDLIINGQLRKALTELENFSYKYPDASIGTSLDSLRDDYQLMADYWQRGFKDNQRDAVYHSLLRKAYTLTTCAMHDYDIAHIPFLSYISRKVRPAKGQYDAFLDTLKDKLENFVSDVAMLELEPELTRKKKKTDIFVKQQQLRANLFDYIWTLGPWKDNVADLLQTIALSPTVDSIDQQLIVMATTLSSIDCFDICKLKMLVNVYLNSTDENVKQRALVGWALSLNNNVKDLFPEQQQLVATVLDNEQTANELTELQIQMIYCLNAEQDNKTIEEDIMPTLLKHNNLHITPHGIEEKEVDNMQDIMDPEASERGMEKLEESFHKMMDMQKAGSDIYFTGFSQMKRFPFFNDICNWFIPFYSEHPGITGMIENEITGDVVRNIVGSTPFCNSDKYSFVLAFQQVADRIPANMRDMLKQTTPIGSGVFSEEEMCSAAYIRRSYLQDLYRFFRLYPSRSNFKNPFSKEDGRLYNFFSKRAFQGTPLENHFCEMVAYMMKRRMDKDAQSVLGNFSSSAHDYQYYILMGNMQLRSHIACDITPSECFTKALSLRPNDRKALIGQARAFFYEGQYVDAADVYSKLIEIEPNNKSHILAYCVCLTNLEDYEKALPLLYKLNFEHPEDVATIRVMARALMGSGKYEQAMKHYNFLCGSLEQQESEDLINCGYCEWFMGKISDAISHFHDYISKVYPSSTSSSEMINHFKEDVIENERKFILAQGITNTEIQLMIDSFC